MQLKGEEVKRLTGKEKNKKDRPQNFTESIESIRSAVLCPILNQTKSRVKRVLL
jgi:hypothetical protein